MFHSPHSVATDTTQTVDQKARRALRKALRKRRRELNRLQQMRAAQGLTRQLLGHPRVIRSRHIALYLANDGEIDPAIFVREARRLGKTCYLPVLHPIYHNRLWFVRYESEADLIPNRFGILEPSVRHGRRRPVRALDLVLLPLVGFDSSGGRLGMGGGFYDRTFAFKHSSHRSPFLMGLAHECQRVDALPKAPWDVPLDAVISDRQSYSFGGTAHPGGRASAQQQLFIGRYREAGYALANARRRYNR